VRKSFLNRLVAVAVISLTTLSVHSQQQPNASNEQAARAAAQAMLALWDQHKFKEMYRDTFNTSMKAQASEDQWVSLATDLSSNPHYA